MRSLPVGDVLLIAGDFTSRGKVDEIEKFNTFLGRFKSYFKEIIITPGNHDFLFEEDFPKARGLITNAKLLMNETHELYNGMTIFGSPVTPWFHDWAFNVKSYEDRRAIWDMIPVDVDIVMTHGPILDVQDVTSYGNHAGCDALRDRLYKLACLKLHVFGHIHEGYGVINKPGNFTHISANVSICRRGKEQGLNEPTVIELND
jgi:Icc-related predicted phosphoesterase